jgi:hypothetical protein
MKTDKMKAAKTGESKSRSKRAHRARTTSRNVSSNPPNSGWSFMPSE